MPVMMNEVENMVSAEEVGSRELDERIAILRRFRALLLQQRDRFRSYLDVLDKQESIIESGNVEDLLAYVDIEEKIIADIFTIQKVIDPLDEMYRTINIVLPNSVEPDEVPDLKNALEGLKNEAVSRSTKNKELLSKRMVELRSEIKTLRNNPYAGNARRPAFNDGSTASLIDIQG